MEQAESNLDSLRVFTTEKWFVQLGMAARGIACSSKCGTSGRRVMQVPAFKLPACSRVTGKPEGMPPGWQIAVVSTEDPCVAASVCQKLRPRGKSTPDASSS